MEAQEILVDIVLVLLYGGVIMLSVVSALYLLLRRGNAIAPEVSSPVRLRRWAAAFLLVCAFSHVSWGYYAYHHSITVYIIVCALDVVMLFPTTAGILMSMLQDRRRPIWPVLIMLVPPIVLFVLSLIRGNDSLFVPLSIYLIAMYALLMIFMFFAVRRYGRWLRDNYADLENKEIWQSLLIMAGFLLFFIMYSSTTEGNRILGYLLQIDCIIIVLLILWRVETIQQLSENAQSTVKANAPINAPTKIGALLKKHCENKKLYLQKDLTLAQLAAAIGTNRYYLSKHFAQQGITYNAYINGLRVNHFINLYHEAVADHRIVTAQDLAFQSGFHSYSTFSATFKQNTGMTVTQWMCSAAE